MEHAFIHLHTHSEYSILDGAVKIPDLVSAAVENNMPAVALTDHGNVFGAVQFFKQARARGIKPILGCEMYVASGSRFDKTPGARENHHYHLVLLVKNETGYRNLCRLITSAYLEGFYYKPRIDKELLSLHSEGLVALSSCLQGEVNVMLTRGLEDAAREVATELASYFPAGDFYLELQDHGLPEQKKINPQIIDLARKTGLPLVVTNDVHYLRRDHAESHDVLLCIQTNKKVSDPDRIRFTSTEFYFKSRDEMAALFPEVPEAIDNTFHIASQCDFEFPTSGYFLPQFHVPNGSTLEEYFEKTARDGFAKRLEGLKRQAEKGELSHPLEDYEKRLSREIALIREMGFEGYFLIVWDLIRSARSLGIPVGPGRGSAAGSLLAYCLEITQIDPIEYDLLFERFLNPQRISLPDIDIDFCGRRRAEVIDYVTKKYGQENVCQIITFGTMAARAAIRDVGRVLEVPLPEVDKVAKMIPLGPDQTIENALKMVPQLREMRDKNAKIAHLLSVAQKLEGQVRHPSIHAAGIVITPRPLVEFIPLYQSVKGEITTQFPMGDIEAIGLLKMDILGLRNLTVIDDAVKLIESGLGEKVDIENVPLDDPETFALFQAGNTDGVFQFESRGMKDLLRKFRPEAFRDLIALNALYRPGPLGSGMTDDFIKRRNHPEQVTYDFPELEPVLRETRGIIAYQEQVMRIATDLAGFSMAEADILRKAMGKKDTAMMKDQKQRFLQGAKSRGISSSKAGKMFEQIHHFAGYGFNKSHAAVYAYLAFQTAYLKAHYPRQFMAALLTSEAERGATDQVVKYINECKEMGLRVLPPDINDSELNFSVRGDAIRFGLAAIKNVGAASAEGVIEERRRRGKFEGPFDVVAETDSRVVNRKVLENLIKAGAFDSLGWPRSRCFHLIDPMIDYAHEMQKLRASRQNSLFGGDTVPQPPISEEILGMSEWNEALFLSYEKDALGFYITGHPLTQFGSELDRLVSHKVSELDEEKDFSKDVTLAGIVTNLKLLKTRKEERMATFFLEDLTGGIEVVAFPEAYGKNYESIRADQPVWVKGRFMGEGDNRRIMLVQIMPLAEALRALVKRIVIRVSVPGLENSTIEALKAVLDKHPGECPVQFELVTPAAYKVEAQSAEVQSVEYSDTLVKEIRDLLGDDSVQVEY
jgi:DNA polymerase-3 subunit alpha